MVVVRGDTCVVPLMLALPISEIHTFTDPGAFQMRDVDCPLCIVVCPMLISGGTLGITVIVTVDDTELLSLPFATNV